MYFRNKIRKIIRRTSGRRKSLFLSFVLITFLAGGIFLSFQSPRSVPSEAYSSEIQIAATSPAGESGGLVVPASCAILNLHDEPLYGLPCSSCNVLGTCCPGAYQCGGVCSAAVPPVPPVINAGAFWAFPTTIPYNSTTLLNWTTFRATSLFIDNGVGPVAPAASGSITTPPLLNTTTFTLIATGPGGVMTAQATVTVTGGPDFKICPASAIVDIVPFQFRAYYRANGGTIDCANLAGTTDVTDAVAWLSSNQSVARVGNNDGNPRGRVARGVTTGSSTISVTPYLGLHASAFAIANVVCVPTNTCASAIAANPALANNKCSNDPTANFTINDGCGFSITCSGTRTCDFNWKEVGQ